MNNNELFNRLLGIQKLQVIKSDFIGEEKLHLEVVSTLSVTSCPDCGQIINRVHYQSESQMIRGFSIVERQCYLVCRAWGSNVSNAKRRLSSVLNENVQMSVTPSGISIRLYRK